MKETLTQKFKKTYNQTGDEVTSIDQTNTFTDKTNLTNNNNFTNNLSFNRFDKETNRGYEAFWNSNFEFKTNNSKTVTDNESDATSSVDKTNGENTFNHNNLFGVRFTGYKTEEKGDNSNDNTEQTLKDNSCEVSSREDGITFEGEYGYKLKDLGLMSTDFKLINRFTGAYTGNSNTTYTKKVTTTNTDETTVTTKESLVPSIDLSVSNTATPTWDFGFNFSDTVKVAARIDAPTTISYTRNGIDYYTTKSTTVVKDLEHGTQTKYVSNEQSMASGASTLNENKYDISVSPKAKVGIVWAVKPGKFNINLGATANAGTYSCAVTTKTASKKLLKNKEVYTDEFGVKTVTTDNKTPVNPTAVEESVETEFTASKVTVKGSFGPTIFINDKVSLDMLLITNTETGFGIGTLINSSYANISINVKF